jgi:hypothetical protein
MSHFSSSNWPSRFLLSTDVNADWTNARNGRRICSRCDNPAHFGMKEWMNLLSLLTIQQFRRPSFPLSIYCHTK